MGKQPKQPPPNEYKTAFDDPTLREKKHQKAADDMPRSAEPKPPIPIKPKPNDE